MNNRFPFLSLLSKTSAVGGWILFIGGGGFCAVGLLVILLATDMHGLGLLSLIGGGVVSLAGLAAVAIGEAVGVVFAIEANTRRQS